MNYTTHDTVLLMNRIGGNFARNLSATWIVADANNRQRIEAAFPELFERYRDIQQTLSEKS